MNTSQRLLEYLEQCPIISTHSHHLQDHRMVGFSLFKLISFSYANWIMKDPAQDNEVTRRLFFEKYRCNSYAYWLIRAIEELYPLGKPFSAETWDEYDAAVRKAYADPEHHMNVLRKCGYTRAILDRFEEVCSDNGHPELFVPALRCDSFLYGFHPENPNPDGVRPFNYIPFRKQMTLDEYVFELKAFIRRKVQTDGVVALKLGIAYVRDLHFRNSDAGKAARAFMNPSATADEIRDFQDYIMHQLVEAARETDLPLQIHTGLASLKDVNAMALYNLISENPDVRFDLFHGSYPWTDDILGLAHNFNNVYIDTCWLQMISPSRAERFLREALEVSDAQRIVWGCDTWTSEESYGSVLSFRQTLSRALASMVDDGCFGMDYAELLGENILYRNAQKLFRL